MKKLLSTFCIIGLAVHAIAIDNPGIAGKDLKSSRFTLVKSGRPRAKIVLETDESAVKIASENLAKDFERVTGAKVPEKSDLAIVIRIDPSLAGRRELYRMSVGDRKLVISGSDRRGAVYGIYELSEQIGVSPWYDWLDAPLPKHETLAIDKGEYTNGEPAVRYRGIFLNDEAPCLTSWVKKTYGTDHGDHRFYARIGELILRLRGNFLWPAMWQWAFYADDPENSRTLSDMGVIVGTSHHEPMARNHREWARKRNEYGAWNYATNKDVLDTFFAEGVRRAKNTEDLITIGMRGDGDAAMEGSGDVGLMERIIASQREIIERETGKAASEVPQVWALYKEVQDYYDNGLKVPDDVTILLCDDNWGNVRRLPNAKERKHPGGCGMYYHFDYVGAPRNSKFFNVTSAISQWEQMTLAYEYGVDRLWIVNVGDLKMQEYPISLFMDMAWNPKRYTPATLHRFTEKLCQSLFGRKEAKEAARILDTTSRWAMRATPEQLDAKTYDLASGEWAKVAGDYAKLLEDAEAQYVRLPDDAKACYYELVLFHVRVMANLYHMYYAQAMNCSLARKGASEAEINAWADDTEACFATHAALCAGFHALKDGKWDGFAKQKIIGYTSWNDGFPADACPAVKRVGEAAQDAKGREAAQAGWLGAKEKRIYSIQRKESRDKDLGDNWWMRRHEKILADIKANPEKAYDLVLCGDSITHRWERQGKDAYVNITNSLKVLNLGFGADSARNLLWRLREGELDGYRAKVVQVLIGTNSGSKESPQDTAAQIRAVIREIHAHQPKATILLCPILPRDEADGDKRAKNNAVNELLKPLADGKIVVWTDWGALFANEDGSMKGEYTNDNLHPNAKGYAMWAEASVPVWREAVSKSAVGASPVARPLPKTGNIKKATDSIVIEAPHFTSAEAGEGYRWELLPGLGRTLGGVEVYPRTTAPKNASLSYKVNVPEGVDKVDVTVVIRSTLAFSRKEGHRYTVGFAGGEAKEVNFNSRLNEDSENVYSVFYPTVAKRVIETKTTLPAQAGEATLELKPLDPGVVFEKIIVNWNGAKPVGHLWGAETVK